MADKREVRAGERPKKRQPLRIHRSPVSRFARASGHTGLNIIERLCASIPRVSLFARETQHRRNRADYTECAREGHHAEESDEAQQC
jgi:hypothetical protein